MNNRFSIGMALGLLAASLLAVAQGVNAPQGGTLTLYDTNGNSYTFPATSGAVSLDGVVAFGELNMSIPASVTATSGTPIKVAGTTALGDATNFDMPISNRLRYTAVTTEFFKCSVSTTLTVSLNNQLISVFLSDTGVVDTTTETRDDHGTGMDETSHDTAFIVQLAQNEYVELFVDSSPGNSVITAERLSLVCTIID